MHTLINQPTPILQGSATTLLATSLEVKAPTTQLFLGIIPKLKEPLIFKWGKKAILACLLMCLDTLGVHAQPCDIIPGLIKDVTSNGDFIFNNAGLQRKNVEIKANINITGETYFMVPDVSIIVKPGFTATFTNCTFTMDAACRTDSLWQGFAVDADRNFSQYSPSGQQVAGKLILNNCTVEWAKSGVLLGSDYWNSNGGIIEATGTTFRNCRKGVEFYSYPYRNRSKFVDCNFRTDEFMPTIYNGNLGQKTSLNTHVSMWAVKGILFRGCQFERRPLDSASSVTTVISTNNADLGRGIVSIDASYTIENSCTGNAASVCQDICATCTGGRPSSFYGLYRGIDNSVYNSLPNDPWRISVAYSRFYNNEIGIQDNNSKGTSIIHSHFNNDSNISQGVQTGVAYDCQASFIGIDMKYCRDFTISNDTFLASRSSKYACQYSKEGVKLLHCKKGKML